MTTEKITAKIVEAIRHSVKVQIWADANRPDHYVLFRPYLVVRSFRIGLYVEGLIEEAHGRPLNTMGRYMLDSLADVKLLDEKFEIPLRTEYSKTIIGKAVEIIAEVNPVRKGNL